MAVTTERPEQPSPADQPSEAARPPWPGVYYGYWILGGAFVSQLVSIGMMTSIVGPFVNPMTDSLGWTTSQFFMATTVSRFVMSGIGFVIGASVDRHGGRRFMFAGAFVLGGALFLAGSVTELWQWILLRGVMFTMGAALVGNLVVNVTMSKWWVTKRGRMIGFSSMGVSTAGIIFPWIATRLIGAFGWQEAWRILAVVAVLAILPVASIMRRQPEDYGWRPDGLTEEEDRAGGGDAARADYENSFTRREALRTRALYLIVLAFGLGGVGIQVMLVQAIPFLEDNGYASDRAALLMAVMSLMALVSKPFWGWSADQLEPKTAAAIGFIQAGAALVIIVFAANQDTLPFLVVGFALMGWGFGGQIPLQETIWASYFGRRYLGSVRSVAMPISLVIGASSPLIVAWYRDSVGDYNGVFLGVAACWVLAAVMVMFVRKPTRPQRPPSPEPAQPAPPISSPAG